MNPQSEREIALGSNLERGATAVEYGLLVALIAGVIISIVMVMGSRVIPLYQLVF